MKYAHLEARLFNTPLLLTKDYGTAITSAVADRLGIEPLITGEALSNYTRPAYEPSLDKSTGIVTYPIVGAMVHRGGFMESLSGMGSYTAIQGDLSRLLEKRDIRGVLLDIDSGGGEVAGLQELAEFVQQANQLGDKPIWAIANTTAGSAAYWLATTADRLYVAPNSHVGSIGVYVQHRDVSKAMEKKGVVTSYIFAGKHKVDGNPFEPLGQEVRDELKQQVEAIRTEFAEAIARNRAMDVNDVLDTEARVYGPKEAVELGLADGEATLGEVLATFETHLNQSVYLGGSNYGASMTDRATYTQADLDAAKTKAHAEGVREGQANVTTQVAEARQTERSAVGAALKGLYPDDARAETFCDALAEGTSINGAAKLAGKHTAPKAEVVPPAAVVAPAKTYTQVDVDNLMKAHTPSIAAGEEQNNDKRASRLAELGGVMKSHNQGRGYAAR